jgi:hypothetical protein
MMSFYLIHVTNKRPVGRPYRTKYIVLEWLFMWWLGTLIGGAILYAIEPAPGGAMLFISGIIWYIGTLIECYIP